MLALDFLSGLAIWLAWVGWGGLLVGGLRATEGGRDIADLGPADWGLKAAWGCSLIVCLGGISEFTCLVSTPLVWFLLVAGWLLCAGDVWLRRAWRDLSARPDWLRGRGGRIAAVLLLAALAILSLRLVASTTSELANIHDDHQGYLVFPVRMLETGCIGQDPFNHRRLVSALGGKSFLDTFALAQGSPFNLHLVDAGLGLWLVFALLLGRLRRLRVAAPAAGGLLLFIAVIPPPQVNMTALMLGVALLLGLYRTLEERWADGSLRRAVLVALVAAATVALKNTLLPPVALVLALSYLIRYVRDPQDRRSTAASMLLCAGLTLGFLLPWMLALRSATGTMFFGLLGHGVALAGLADEFHGPEQILSLLAAACTTPEFVALLALSSVAVWRGRPARSAALGFAMACALASVVVVVVTTAPARTAAIGAQRYGFPLLFAAILVLLADLLAPSVADDSAARARKSSWVAGCLALVLVMVHAGGAVTMMKRSAGSVWATWVLNEERQRDVSRRQAAEAMWAAQNSVPAGEPLLVRLEQPYLMDFGRNPIRVVDHPGAVSPPPGLPVFEGGDAIRDYLVGQGIRYLAFSYRTDANFSRERFAARLDPGFHPVPRHLAEMAFAFDEALHELGTTRRKLYDDGDTFVLDLKEPGPDASEP